MVIGHEITHGFDDSGMNLHTVALLSSHREFWSLDRNISLSVTGTTTKKKKHVFKMPFLRTAASFFTANLSTELYEVIIVNFKDAILLLY